jgi:hypothetical protein
LQDPTKFTQIRIFGLIIYHLATLMSAQKDELRFLRTKREPLLKVNCPINLYKLARQRPMFCF